jgi:hypothetical protein
MGAGVAGVNLLVLATEAGIKDRDLWYPTIIGVLVVIAAVALFMGTIYLLLATNVGARLGFLISVAALSGFMVLLSLLWMSTASPLNTLRGRVPSWKAVEVIKGGDLSKSKIDVIRDLDESNKLKDPAEEANVKAALDQVVVTPEGGQSSESVGGTSRFQLYSSTTDYLTPSYYETGGGELFSQSDFKVDGSFPILHFSLHTPKYAVVNICPVDAGLQIVPYGESPPTPKCDTSKPIDSIVFEYDLGSVRVPPFVAFVGSTILFILSLLGLHWRERDLQEQAAALQAEADRATKGAIERAPEKV